MKRTEINNNLSAAVSQLMPKGEYEKIVAKLKSAPPVEKVGIKMTSKKSNSITISYKKLAGLTVAACLVIVVGLFGFNYYNTNFAVDSIIDIDVNPSVEFTTNKKDKVIDVSAINKDGQAILGDMELKNTDIDVAVNAVIGSMVTGGYLEGADNEILVTVKNDDSNRAENLKAQIISDIDTSLSNYNVSSSIINQTINQDAQLSDAEKLAKELGISIGKANFVLNLSKKDSSLKAEELATLSLKEIAEIVNTKKIDISDIADHDPDDTIWENIAETVEDANEQAAEANKATQSVVSNNNGVITKKSAREIALKDAGLSESEVTFVEEKLESDKGKKVYEIEFYGGGTEYDYEIDAKTGKIISSDLDIDDYEIPDSSKPQTTSKPETESKPSNSSNSLIGVGKAKKAALNHANVKEADAYGLKAELDEDDGVLYYDVEFKSAGYEYDYEINAKSGKVIVSNREKDDDYVETNSKATVSKLSTITKAKAKKLALEHAGVKQQDAKFDRTELEEDDGMKHYEIEFSADGYDYDYDINAQSGAIIANSKEKDDDYIEPSNTKPISKISKNDAKKAALSHAGVKNGEAYDISVELDEDDGTKLYEIEFKSGNVEYQYEISATDGTVISHEKEIDD